MQVAAPFIKKIKKDVHGILLLDKPPNMTSNCALQKVKNFYQAKKAGHTGSLDPIATGMLPICFGEATKFAQILLDSDKSYQVSLRLGIQTTTGDKEGEVILKKPIPLLSEEKVQKILVQFEGELEQLPPMYSAIKYQGKPLYQLARRGIVVERKLRKIHIFSIRLENLAEDQLTFYVHCSKGTYVRTLVEEIGKALGSVAHVIALRRLMITPYHNASMYSLEEITNGANQLNHFLLPLETALVNYPKVVLTAALAFYIQQGHAVRCAIAISHAFARLYLENGQFLGLGEVMPDGRIKPRRLINTTVKKLP